jgi:hypothetical protein
MLERYIEGLFKITRIYEHGTNTFRDSGVTGLGTLKIHPVDGKLVCERIVWDEIVVDERACRSAPPRTKYQRKLVDRESLREAYPENFEKIGISRLSAQALKPAGLESAVALREYNDMETQRFAIQAQAYERMYLDAAHLMLAWSKEMHKSGSSPKVHWRRDEEQIDWSKVDLEDVPYTLDLDAASSLSRTPAGRTQTVIEWMQAGIVNMDEGRKLLEHPDLGSAMSLYNAAIEDIDAAIEDILDGRTACPEAYQNLTMGMWRMQMRYVKRKGAPEEVLEGIRQWIEQAEWLSGQPDVASAQQNVMGGGVQQQAPQGSMAQSAMALGPA